MMQSGTRLSHERRWGQKKTEVQFDAVEAFAVDNGNRRSIWPVVSSRWDWYEFKYALVCLPPILAYCTNALRDPSRPLYYVYWEVLFSEFVVSNLSAVVDAARKREQLLMPAFRRFPLDENWAATPADATMTFSAMDRADWEHGRFDPALSSR